METALRNQLLESVEDEYLNDLRNARTDTIIAPIYEIIDHLYETYGHLSNMDVSNREDALKQFPYDPMQPMDVVFTKVREFQDLCELAENAKTYIQLVQIAYMLFQKTGTFNDALLKWNDRQTP